MIRLTFPKPFHVLSRDTFLTGHAIQEKDLRLEMLHNVCAQIGPVLEYGKQVFASSRLALLTLLNRVFITR